MYIILFLILYKRLLNLNKDMTWNFSIHFNLKHSIYMSAIQIFVLKSRL